MDETHVISQGGLMGEFFLTEITLELGFFATLEFEVQHHALSIFVLSAAIIQAAKYLFLFINRPRQTSTSG